MKLKINNFSLLTLAGLTLLGIAMMIGLVECTSGSSVSSSAQPLQVPVSVNYQPAGVNLENHSDGLGLVDTGTAPIVSVTGCASGYTLANFTITSAHVSLYNGDQNCLVILHSFVFSGNTYNDTNSGAVAFALSGEPSDASGAFATFSDLLTGATATNLIKVFIGTQVSSPVSGASVIVFNFTDISAGATDNVSQTTVATAVPLTVNGRLPPNYGTGGGILFTRYLSTNSNGSGNMSFTLECAVAVTGSSPNFNCPNAADTTQATDNQTTEISYILVPDTFNNCITTSPPTLTVAQANSIFSSPPAGTTVQTITSTLSAVTGGGANGQIAASSADNWANSVPNGGFDTPSVITGNQPIYSGASGTYANGYQYLNDLFIIRRTDASANALSYLYYCVDIAAITQD